MKLLILKVTDMRSELCVSRIERTILQQAGVDAVYADLTTGNVKVRCLDENLTEATLSGLIREAGYHIYAPEQKADRELKQAEQNKLLQRCRWAAVCTAAAILFSVILYLRQMLGLSYSAVIAAAAAEVILSIAVLFLARQAVENGFGDLFAGKPRLESLTSVGVAAALLCSGYSLLAFCRGQLAAADNIYAAAAALALLWTLYGEYLTAVTTDGADEIQQPPSKAAVSQPLTAVLQQRSGSVTVPTDFLLPKDLIIVRKGEKIPVNGMIEAGKAAVDESHFSGSSIPVLKGPKMQALSGSYVCGGELTIRVAAEKTAPETKTEEKPFLSEIFAADKHAALFVPLLLIIAVAASLNWLFYSGNFSLAVKIFCTVLLVASPCVLKPAAAAALRQAVRTSAAQGMTYRKMTVLSAMRQIGLVIFGKTGIVTDKELELTDLITYGGVQRQAALSLAVALECDSMHPVARALRKQTDDQKLPVCEKLQYFPGQGVTAVCQKLKVSFGTAGYISKSCHLSPEVLKLASDWQQQGKNVMFLSVGKTLCAALALAEHIPAAHQQGVADLREHGIRAMLITGDTQAAAERAAKAVGIDKYVAALSQQEKAELISSISRGGEQVAFVNSAVNQYMEGCDDIIYIAVNGKDADCRMRQRADVMLQNNNLGLIWQAVRLSEKMTAVSKQNMKVFYLLLVLCLPAAAGVFYLLPLKLLAEPLYVTALLLIEGLILFANSRRLQI